MSVSVCSGHKGVSDPNPSPLENQEKLSTDSHLSSPNFLKSTLISF